MSTLSGLTSKGEKTKVKFQSLDINNLYRVSRGENLEKQQQKSTLIKHGMQCLGKVPSARRAPKNLPSMKSEHSGSDAATQLVPQGGTGWGKQDTTTTSSTSSSTNTPTGPTGGNGGGGSGGTQYVPGLSLRPQTEGSWTQGGGARLGVDNHQKGGLAPLGPPPQLSAPVGPHQTPQQQGQPQHHQDQQPLPAQFRGVMPPFMYKGSSFATSNAGNSPNAGAPSVNGRGGGSNTRPENRPSPRLTESDDLLPRPIIKQEDLTRMDEISKDVGWATHDDIDYNQKLSFSDDESPPEKSRKERIATQHREQEKINENHIGETQKAWNGPSRGPAMRNRSGGEEEELWVQQKRHQNSKEIDLAVQRARQRREEEEKRFSEATKQAAAKKLQELDERKKMRERDETQGTINPASVPAKPITPSIVPLPDFQKEKEKDRDGQSKPINEKEKVSNERNSNDNRNEDNNKGSGQTSFRHLTQIEAKNVIRGKHAKDSRENQNSGSSNFAKYNVPPRFLKQQQAKNMQMHYPVHQFDARWIQSPGSQPVMNKPANMPAPLQKSTEPLENDHGDLHRDYKKQNSEEVYRSNYRPSPESMKASLENKHSEEHNDYRNHDYERPTEWQRDGKPEREYNEPPVHKPSHEDWHDERRDKFRDERLQERYERPQRPDSRDSRASRESRHSRDSARDSEPREYNWSDSYELNYEEKRWGESFSREREDRRVVPGPITKDRIEADDLKSEKRKLTQLKRGQMNEKKLSDMSKRENKIQEKPEYDGEESKKGSNDGVNLKSELGKNDGSQGSDGQEKHKSSFAESIAKGSDSENKKSDNEMKDKDDKHGMSSGRNRNYQGAKGWGSSEYHRSGWSKRASGRSGRSGGGSQRSSGIDFLGTDSEASVDDHSVLDQNKDQKSPRPVKKFENLNERNKEMDKNKDNKQDSKSSMMDKKGEKQELKRDNYVPRGEPSRHGRGGGSSFRGSRAPMSKRIDGYGPPPSKSPFGNHDDKEKKISDETMDGVAVEDKTKQNQQALSASIAASGKKDSGHNQADKDKKFPERPERNKSRKPNDNKHGKSRNKGDNKREDETCDTSDNSDENQKDSKNKKIPSNKPQSLLSSNLSTASQPRHNNPLRMSSEKRSYRQTRNDENLSRQNSSGALRSQGMKKPEKSEENILCSAIADISLKNKEENEVSEEEKMSQPGESDGFQEVKSKKNVKDKLKPNDEKISSKPMVKLEKDLKNERKSKTIMNSCSGLAQQQQQQPTSGIQPLMATPMNPPIQQPMSSVMPLSKPQYDRSRTKLAPRFAKQRENSRLQKVQQLHHHHHHQGLCPTSGGDEMAKVSGQSMGMYGAVKEPQSSVVVPPVGAGTMGNAWDKPLGSQLRAAMDAEVVLSVGLDKGVDRGQVVNENGREGNDKDKSMLDGTTPPVNTIIFENTNFKSAPVRPEKPRSKLDDPNMDASVMSGFNKPMVDLINKDKQAEAMQLPLSFKDDNMKLDFFDSDLSHLSDEKITKNICLPRSIHAMTSGNSTISTAESLNFKIASVKKVWENATPGEHCQEDNSSFGATFVSDATNSLDPNSFSKNDGQDDNHEVYSPSPNQTATNSTTNVCKVKPTQQVSGSSGQTMLNSGAHQQHSGMMAPGLMGNPLSPPPMQPVIGAGVGIGQPPQPFTTNQHLGFQASLGGSTQYNMPAIPSPPTVLYNSTQQLQPAQTAGLYGAFQLDAQTAAGVLGSQATRSQFSQYSSHYGLGQTAPSPYSAQSVYLQQAHPPPTAQPAPQELYTNMSSYRLSTAAAAAAAAAGPFGQSQQLNNPSTVLISSSSNSLMSASVKPSSQQMSAIGTKSGGVGQAYQQQSQQGQQVYMAYEPALPPANYLPGAAAAAAASVMQARAPQNNVVPALQPSSSYYSGSTGSFHGGFY